MIRRQRTKDKTRIYKILHKILKIEKLESIKNRDGLRCCGRLIINSSCYTLADVGYRVIINSSCYTLADVGYRVIINSSCYTLADVGYSVYVLWCSCYQRFFAFMILLFNLLTSRLFQKKTHLIYDK